MIDSPISFAAFAAAASAITLGVLGVDYYSTLYGFIGALMALPHVERMGRWRAVLFVVLSTVAGAAMGNALVAYLGTPSRPVLYVSSLAGGLLAQAIAGLALHRLSRLVDYLLRGRGRAGGDGGKT